jgi:mono/diheme cytochrome c family protein
MGNETADRRAPSGFGHRPSQKYCVFAKQEHHLQRESGTTGAPRCGVRSHVGFFVSAWRPSIAPIARPAPGSFPADLVAEGESLSALGHCASCHTQPGGQPFAGGYALHTPFGIIYGDNISPDPQSGIGAWLFEAFTRAVREGVARNGSHLWSAFPYYAFTKLSDDDVKACTCI